VADTATPLPTTLAAISAYLGLCADGGRVARWRLAGAIWPELSETQARRMLSGSLYRLRRMLGDAAACLQADGAWVCHEGVWLDGAAFRSYAAGATLSDWLQALDLYHADFLPDCDGDWLSTTRVELQQTYLATLERVTGVYTQQGNLADGIAAATRWTAADPLNETAHMALMRLYGRLGRYSAALQHYAQLVTLLDEELGVAPLPETSSLAEQLRRELEVAQTRAALERQQINRQPFVGRTAERTAVMEALDLALAGRGGLVLIEGAPGMGKSRLLQELAAAGAWRGFQVAWGHASDRAAATPYSPLDQALAQVITPSQTSQLRAQLSPVALDALAGLVPHLRPPDELHRLTRPNLSAAVSEGLHLLAEHTPLLLLLDDVQWASPAFWQACAFSPPQTAALGQRPILIALAYRPAELHAQGNAPALEEMMRRWQTTRLALRGLSSSEVQELVNQASEIAGYTLPPAELTALYAMTDGNPLYVQESLLGQTRAPQPFAHVMLQRIADLSADARSALEMAAVLGRDCTTPLWEHVIGQSVLQVVDELSAARFILATSNGYTFRHDLIHSHVIQAIPAERQRLLHQRVALALSADPATTPERLAWHFERAGDPASAIRFYREAGERAFAAFAYSTALDYFNHGFDLLDSQLANTDHERLALLCARQRVLGVVAQFPAWRSDVDALEQLALKLDNPAARLEALEARIVLLSADSATSAMMAVAQEAAALAQQLEQPISEARIWRAYGFQIISSAVSPAADTLPMLQRSVLLAERAGDLAMQVASLCTLAFAECMLGQTTAAHTHVAQGLALIELHPELYPARGDVLRMLAHVALNRGEWETARATMHKALHLLEEQDDKWPLAVGLFMAVFSFGGIGQHAEAQAVVERMRGLLRFADVAPYSNWSLYTYTVAMECALQSGDFAAAEAVVGGLQEWLDHAPKSGAALYLLTEVGALRLFQNRPREALRYLREALPLWHAARSSFLPLLLTHALAAHLAGEAAEAAESMRVAEEHYATHEIPYCVVLYHFTRFWVRGSGEDLQAAYTMMHAQAAHIRDADLRAAFLGDIRLHTLVTRLWRVRPLAGRIRSLAGLWLRIVRADAHLPASDGPAANAQELQQTVSLARVDAPLGIALRPDQRVAVLWTLHTPADAAITDKTTQRQQRLRRLLSEAAAQGAAPTDDDLAEALNVSRRTILRDMAALAQTGDLPATRRRKQ
jgi:DNA-binding SARP family transcriptional activator